MSHDNLPVKDPELGHSVPDPGLEEHVERFADVDEGAGNRAYRAKLLALLGIVRQPVQHAVEMAGASGKSVSATNNGRTSAGYSRHFSLLRSRSSARGRAFT